MKNRSVLLVSVDAVKPDILLNQEKYGIELKTLNELMRCGSYSKGGNTSIFPSFTYCAHQSIITGCHPKSHGIYTNKLYDPNNIHNDAWYWYVNDRVPTLWEEAQKHGYYTVNIGFPTSVSAPTDLNIPEFWRDTTEYDSELLSAVSLPQGLSKEFERAYNKHIPCGLWRVEDDETKLEQCVWLIENKLSQRPYDKSVFMTTYFASYDDIAHNVGTYHQTALAYLQRTDELLGILIETLRKELGEDLVICIISDHGMLDNIGDVNINAEIGRAGLSEKAFCQRSGGVGLINTQDDETTGSVKALLEKLMDEYPDKLTDVMTGEEACKKRGGCCNYDLVVTTAPGWEIRENLTGDFIVNSPSQVAQHGYDENCDDMKAIFIISGAGIPIGEEIEGKCIVDIAPTLADIMGFEMKHADGKKMF